MTQLQQSRQHATVPAGERQFRGLAGLQASDAVRGELTGIASDTVLRALARKATGCSGADIERLVREARQKARRERRSLSWSDLDNQFSSSKPIRPESLRWRVAVHEAGHAVARLVLKLGTVTLITIDGPNGNGMVACEEPTLVAETEDWLGSMLVAKLAGRAAEEVFLGNCVAGSGGGPDSDLGQATALAFQIETSLGFGGEMPLLHLDAQQHGTVLAHRRDIAARVNARLEAAYGAARQLVTDHEPALRDLAGELVRCETLERNDVDRIIRARGVPTDHRPMPPLQPQVQPEDEQGRANRPVSEVMSTPHKCHPQTADT